MPISKIAFFEIEKLESKHLSECNLQKGKQSLFKEVLDEAIAKNVRNYGIVSIFIYSRITDSLLKRLPKLKLIATRSTGYDHIDLSACKRRKITVVNVPFYGENTVAEHTFALILSLSRNIHKAYIRTMRSDFSLEGLQGFDLKGKTLGVVGAGHIGLHVIRMAKGFGMNVLVYDVKKDNFLAEVLNFEYRALDDLLRNSDIITLHAPYNPHTHHLINKKNIHLIKKGALLINTARGGLIDTGALTIALDKGILAGAGLDVLEGEELIKEENQLISDNFSQEQLKTLLRNHILLSRENVVITPHIAFNSREATARIMDTTINNIQKFLAGQPENVISGVTISSDKIG